MNGESITRTQESGAFIRTTIRRGKKRRQKTERIKKNDRKVILGNIGDFQVYTYPYDYPDVVFIGQFPISTKIDLGNINQLFRCYNKIKTYLNGHYYSEGKRTKEAKNTRLQVERAYKNGLKRVITRKKEGKT